MINIASFNVRTAEARFSNPREEHLISMMVAAGVGGEGRKVYGERVLETAISEFVFG